MPDVNAVDVPLSGINPDLPGATHFRPDAPAATLTQLVLSGAFFRVGRGPDAHLRLVGGSHRRLDRHRATALRPPAPRGAGDSEDL